VAVVALAVADSFPSLAQIAPKPSLVEIRAIEAKLKMPREASAIENYRRYYYLQSSTQLSTIVGVYIEKGWLPKSDQAALGIVVVSSQADIPDIEDGGCSVIYVEFNNKNKTISSAECSAEIMKKP
jgi:hypothetical protein